MRVSGWGRYPWQDADVELPVSSAAVAAAISRHPGPVIARGMGRSYGDSALGPRIVGTRRLDHFIEFDDTTGRLRCEAGVCLAEIIAEFTPRGWFLPVTPGTRYVTIGGAIASDVHGKNHHVAGSFCDHVESLEILLGSGSTLTASPMHHADLFHATCGGMGLTGIILEATLRLKRISSSTINSTIIKAPHLESALVAFSESKQSTYSVAWIDCLARGRHLGRSLVMLGEHAVDGELSVARSTPLPVPFDLPSSLMGRASIRAFNSIYYHKAPRAPVGNRVTLESYFYPLDSLANWNRLYGRKGFVQYQFVLPIEGGSEGLKDVLTRIAGAGMGSFLAVLKMFGRGNDNYLSFPMEGYTLALDFRMDDQVLRFLDHLDSVVSEYGGRIYLTKDARMSGTTFRTGYPRWQQFEAVRAKYFATGKFASAQSRRLSLA